jgi:Xaa-Pro aminopeptidase
LLSKRLYLSGWGEVRIEDDILVTPEGYEVPSGVPKQFAGAVVS